MSELVQPVQVLSIQQHREHSVMESDSRGEDVHVGGGIREALSFESVHSNSADMSDSSTVSTGRLVATHVNSKVRVPCVPTMR